MPRVAPFAKSTVTDALSLRPIALSDNATAIAIGTLGSSLAKTQLFAALFGGATLVLFLLGWLLGKISSPPINDIFSYTALFERHFQPFMRGRINTESLVYYLSVTLFFLLLSTRILQARRHA